jgi:2-keto-4-pentenoate hydratase/2-oxohepta-3-ene-1,7-dioic acid hydratase in catechol pathway
LKLATIKLASLEIAAVATDDGLLPLETVNARLRLDFPTTLYELLVSGQLERLWRWYQDEGEEKLKILDDYIIPYKKVKFAPLYRRPRKIWGIGLNYKNHAADLSETAPTDEPASFMKPDTAIIGHGDTIEIPLLSEKTTGEAELGIIFGKTCRNVALADWQNVVAGYTTIIDMTAEDILRRNPRNLTQSKSFDTFFSFGPLLYTVDEFPDLTSLTVSTVHNGSVRAANTVANMTFPPDFLVSYHSRIMTLLPGDIISTGTPGAVPLHDGDIIACHITGCHLLENPVMDLKMKYGV